MKSFGLAVTVLLLVAGASFLAMQAAAGARQEPAAGAEQKPVVFSHEVHLEQEIGCTDCHTNAEQSMSAEDDNRPEKEICLTCHEEGGKEVGSIAWGAPREAQGRVEKIVSELNFSHKAHLERGADCEYCHLAPEATQGKVAIPSMESCSRCHENRAGRNDCAICHKKPSILRPDDHDYAWINHHREAAREDDTRCGKCHSQNYCQECHEGARPLPTQGAPQEELAPYGSQLAGDRMIVEKVHELNYRYTHPMDAEGKETECRTCHSSERFCADCHEGEGDPSRFKPSWHGGPDWGAVEGAVGTGGGRHAEMAERDIELCAACHEVTLAGTDPTCLRCHMDRNPGLGNDPRTHEEDVVDKAVHGPWHEDDDAVCYICHTRGPRAGVGFCGYCHGEEED